MAVTYNLATNIGKVRLLISDKNILNPVFQDEEIQVFLDNNSDVLNLAAAEALESWASSYGANANSERIGDYSYSQKIVDDMLNLAKRLRERESSTPAITSASPGVDWAAMDLLGEEEES